MNISLRKITVSDAPLLIKWRNADAQFFGDGTLLTPDSHNQWYKAVYLNDPRDHMYLVLCDTVPVGTIGVKLNRGTEITRVLLGEKKLARSGVMSAALNLVMSIYPGPVWLTVKQGNFRAISLYEKNGFVITHEGDGLPAGREKDDLLCMTFSR